MPTLKLITITRLSPRLMNLIEAEDKVSYEGDFKRIKYDNQLPKPFGGYSWMNINYLEKSPQITLQKLERLILRVQNWDRKATAVPL